MSMKRVLIFFALALALPVRAVRMPSLQPAKKFTVMLAPTGDAKTTGRIIDKNFERWIAWEFARAVKEQVERDAPQVCVVMSRGPGEVVYPLQAANFANRLGVDLFVSIHFYCETGVRPRCTFYRFSRGDDFVSLGQGLAFHPYDRAHLLAGNQTASFATQMHDLFCSETYQKQFDVRGPYAMPFGPLVGVCAPAVGIEMSTKAADGWRAYVAPLAGSIGMLAHRGA